MKDPTPWGATMWPSTPLGWSAVALAAVGLGSWVVLPLMATLFHDRYPVTDSYLMPVLGLVLVAVSAVVNLLVLTWGRQRSSINIVATGLTIAASLFFGAFVVGEGP